MQDANNNCESLTHCGEVLVEGHIAPGPRRPPAPPAPTRTPFRSTLARSLRRMARVWVKIRVLFQIDGGEVFPLSPFRPRTKLYDPKSPGFAQMMN